jgi:cytochrome P450
VIVQMLGFPQEDADIFRHFIRQVLEDVDQSPEERQELINQGEIDAYMDNQIAEHVANPRDDLTSFLVQAEIDGNKLAPEHIRGTMVLLMIAGIDTTWSAIGASLWHLARHPGDRRRLSAEPALMDTAVEEFLRAYAPVTMARLVAQDSTGSSSRRGTGCCSHSLLRTATPRLSPTPTRCNSTVTTTATPPSAWASIVASGPTWRAWSYGWPCRSGWPSTRSSSWPTRPR